MEAAKDICQGNQILVLALKRFLSCAEAIPWDGTALMPAESHF